MKSRIIHCLKQSTVYLSGEELSRRLNVSRAAIWKCIEELRSDGYVIEAVPHHGYRLAEIPDKLFPDEVQFGLGTRKLGCCVHHFDVINSTMDEAFRKAEEHALEGTVIIAESQSHGRGRMGRVWSSPKGKGLYFSLILRPQYSAWEVPRLTLVAAVAVCEAVIKVTGVKPQIKWPNDLYVNGKKLAGILTEMRAEVDRVGFVIIGVGLNVNTPSHQLPPEAIPLKNVVGKKINRVVLLQEILRSFERRYLTLSEKSFSLVLEEWRRHSLTLGRQIHFMDQKKEVHGEAIDIAEDGGLLVKLDSGRVIKRIAGDIVL